MKAIHRNIQPFSLSEALLQICASLLQAESIKLIQRRGGKLVVYANDAIGNAIAANGFYEWTELEAIFDFLKPLHIKFHQSLAIDVGANIGNHSVYFLRYFKEVHAFEPHPITSRILEINASLHSGIKVYSHALSDRCGDDHLIENPVNLGESYIAAPADHSIVITSKKLDDLDFERGQIGLIKLDVEGHEAKVLRGGIETLQQSMPIVLFEAHTTDFEGPMEEVDLLKSLGYRFAWIQPLSTGVEKYIRRMLMLLRGQKSRLICTGESIPPANHSMIVAVPPRWQTLLSLR